MRLFLLMFIIMMGKLCTAQSLVFDSKAWKYDAMAPIRSTPLVKGEYVYVGTTAGDMLCIHKKTGQLKWKFHSRYAINSSPAEQNGKIFFSDNEQTVYALDKNTGKVIWKFRMGAKLPYAWGFDYYYSSPRLFQDKLIIGGDDGYIYQLNQQTGKLVWKFQTSGIVRSTGTVYKNKILFGNHEATMYALEIQTGKKVWEFKISGDTVKNEDYGFDRRAIIGGAVISGNRAVFGARDGLMYCINADDGSLIWKHDHVISWIITTVAIKDSFVIAGTSDKRFVQAVNLYTGKEIWKTRTTQAVWSSPLIYDDVVYSGGYDGQLLALDLKTGSHISSFTTNGIIYSSPVISDSLLYVGSDDGNLYALSARSKQPVAVTKKFVFAAKTPAMYYRPGSAERITNYLINNGCKKVEADTLGKIIADEDGAKQTAIIVPGSYLPYISQLRKFLDNGGRLVFMGNNPLFFDINDTTKAPTGLDFPQATAVFGIDYGQNDTRAFGGLYASFPTAEGKLLNLPDHWVSNFGYDAKQVDVILGKNENGLATAFVKKYNNGGMLVQIWMSPEIPVNMDAIIKAAESKF